MADSSMAGRTGSSRVARAGGFSHPLAIVLVTTVAAGGLVSTLVGGPDADDRGVVRGIVTLAEGSVTYAGTPPEGEAIDMSADDYCRDQHDTEVVDRPVRVGPGGGLADVLVHVMNAPSGGAANDDDEVLLDQVGCIYAPAVVAARADQTVTIRNSDQTLHNVRVSPRLNRGFNLGQPIRGMESRRSFPEPELGIPVRCDIHGWMHASIHVLDHGFFALSGEDGSFELPDLPAGEYAIEAWHPTLGTSTQTVTVSGGGSAEIAFEFGS